MQMGMFQAEEFGDLQRLVDGIFSDGRATVDRLDMVVQAEILDLVPDLMEIVELLPPVRPDQLRPRRAWLGRDIRYRRVRRSADRAVDRRAAGLHAARPPHMHMKKRTETPRGVSARFVMRRRG